MFDERFERENKFLIDGQQTWESMEGDTSGTVTGYNCFETCCELVLCGVNSTSSYAENFAELHMYKQKGNNIFFNQAANMDKENSGNWLPTALAEKDEEDGSSELSFAYKYKMPIMENHPAEEINDSKNPTRSDQEETHQSMNSTFSDKMNESLRNDSSSTDSSNIQMTKKRVSIQMLSRKSSAREQVAKLINLPSSLEELLKIASKYYLTRPNFMKETLKQNMDNNFNLYLMLYLLFRMES